MADNAASNRGLSEIALEEDRLPEPYYEDEAVTIYHADAAELLPQLRADVVITDPPYGVGLRYAEAYDDERASWFGWFNRTWPLVMNAGDRVLVTPGIRNLWLYPPATWVLCWGKPGSTRRSDLGGFNEWEPVLMYGKKRVYNDLKVLPDCANHATDAAADHPCPKPLRLLTWLVAVCTEPTDTVLDPFAGSGTTLRAAKDLGRKAIGIELEERYCEIAAKRMGQEVLDLAV